MLVTALEKPQFMIKKGLFYSGIALLIVFISTAFKPVLPEEHQWFYTTTNEVAFYDFPSQNISDYNNKLPFTGKFFIGFKQAIAFKESQGKYHKVNSLGYMGKYQFGASTLASIGIKNHDEFMKSPELQEKAFLALLSRNKWRLKEMIAQYEGEVIDGVRITESGVLAAAHLGGVGSVKRFLLSKGAKKCKDQYGASVKSYMKQFGGYETKNIPPLSNPKVF